MDTADRLRVEGYLSLAQDMGYTGTALDLTVDCRNSHTHYCNLMAAIPALTTRARPFNLLARRLLLPKELLAVQGWPVFLDDTNKFHQHLGVPLDAFDSLTDTEFRSLVGNTMSLPAVGSVLLFVLMSARR